MSFLRLTLAAGLLVALTACGGGGLGSVIGGLNPTTVNCDPGTQVQIANPQPNQTGVSSSIGQIVIVANGQNNTLYNTAGQWNVQLTDQYGHTVYGSNLTPYDGRALGHPYTSDYYYASSIGQLSSGSTWNVQLSEQGMNCAPVPLQSFST